VSWAVDAANLAVAIVLVLLAALFAAAEAAVNRLSRTAVQDMTRDGRRGAERLRLLAEDPPRYLNVALLMRVVFELTAVALVVLVCLRHFAAAWQALLLAVGAMVVVSYVVVGVSPRTLGRQHVDSVARASAAVLVPLSRVLGPLPRLLILLGNALTPGQGFREGPFASEAELRELVDLAEANRVIHDDERRMVHSIFELGDTLVREVMVPRTDMVFIERTKTLRQALSLALRSGFSRIPVIGASEDDVVGIVYLKDVVRRTHDFREGESTERVEQIMRRATFVPDSKPADALLREMQLNQIHLAVVVDEYGGTAGIVTIEDLLEEIVGEIADEYDRQQEPLVEHLDNGDLRVSARLHVEELGELFGAELADEDVDTVGGLLAKHLGRVPIPGAQVVVEGLSLTGESAEGRRNRLGTVLVRRVDRKGAAALPDPEDVAEVTHPH